MSGKILRRCDICGKFHAAYLIPNPKGGQMKVCRSCWNAYAPLPPPSAPLLPAITTLDDYRLIYRDEATWLPAMREICRRHGLDPLSLSFAPPGSNVVFWVAGNKVIKLFAPMWQAGAAKEAGYLRTVAASVRFHTPQVCASGEIEGWPYLLLSRVPGTPLDELWSNLNSAGQASIAASLGQCMAELHAIPAGDLQHERPAWEQFRRAQLEGCPTRQAALGAPAAWCADIVRFISDLPYAAIHASTLAIVNGDLNPEHLLCEHGAAGWRVTGMIDFGDACIAHPFYDFVRPALLFQAHPHLRKIMLRAYGFPESAFTPALTRELFTYDLVHEFANIPERLSELENNPPANLEALIAIEWGF